MKVKTLQLTLFLLISGFLYAQDDKEEKKAVEINGYVKYDINYDSRQMVSIREGQFHLYPKNIAKDPDGTDKNDAPSFNMLAIQSRIKLKLSGPEAFGAKTSGAIEGAFFGHSDTDINGFRLRHAYGKLDWEKTSLLFGQTWHPAFITQCFPGTISFNTGAPMQTLARNPQIKITHTLGKISLIGAVLSQRDFTGINADGSKSSLALRNAVMPDVQAQIHYTLVKDDAQFLLAGIGGGYKTLVPQIVTPQGYFTNEKISSYMTLGFVKLTLKPATIKAQIAYGQNLTDLVMLGGYAVSDSIFEPDNSTKGFVKYTNIETLATWIDVHTNGKKHHFGIFAGYTENMGSVDDIVGKIYARGADLQYVYRVAPRYYINQGKMRFAIEPDYTVAGYMKNIDSKLTSDEVSSVGNFRLLVSAFYFF